MAAFFQEMGFMRYPLLLSAVFLLAQIGRAAWAVRAPRRDGAGAMTLHTVLVWGFLCALLGVLGTVVGLTIAADSISRAGTASPALIWGGVKVALSTTVLGLVLLTVAVLAWLAVGFFQRRSAEQG